MTVMIKVTVDYAMLKNARKRKISSSKVEQTKNCVVSPKLSSSTSRSASKSSSKVQISKNLSSIITQSLDRIRAVLPGIRRLVDLADWNTCKKTRGVESRRKGKRACISGAVYSGGCRVEGSAVSIAIQLVLGVDAAIDQI